MHIVISRLLNTRVPKSIIVTTERVGCIKCEKKKLNRKEKRFHIFILIRPSRFQHETQSVSSPLSAKSASIGH